MTWETVHVDKALVSLSMSKVKGKLDHHFDIPLYFSMR